MLTHLAIKDFAVVATAELEFGAGLTVISGETGAGKSILLKLLTHEDRALLPADGVAPVPPS